MTTSDSDDRAARKARADALRRARDRRKASLAASADGPPQKPSGDPPDSGEPNYVDFIDRKMRQKK
jgi:hypothetical protein